MHAASSTSVEPSSPSSSSGWALSSSIYRASGTTSPRLCPAIGLVYQRGTLVTIVVVWLGSFLVNLPRFWHYQPQTLSCHRLGLPVLADADCRCVYYQKLPGDLFGNPTFKSTYTVTWATVAIFVPLVALVVCNWCLVRALRRSSAMQQRCCRVSSVASARLTLNDSAADLRLVSNRDGTFSSRTRSSTPASPGHRITPTLVALVVLFLVLVGPSEILTFAKDVVLSQQVMPNITSNFSVLAISPAIFTAGCCDFSC